MMKAETKAKRRVTLSICGLGMLDETEVETIPHAYPVPPPAPADTGQVATGGFHPITAKELCAEQDPPAPTDTLFAHASAVADHEAALDAAIDTAGLQASWDDVVKDTRLTQPDRVTLYARNQRLVKKLRGK